MGGNRSCADSSNARLGGGETVEALSSAILADQQHTRDRKDNPVADHAQTLQAHITDHGTDRTEQAQHAGAEERAADATLWASGVEAQATQHERNPKEQIPREKLGRVRGRRPDDGAPPELSLGGQAHEVYNARDPRKHAREHQGE